MHSSAQLTLRASGISSSAGTARLMSPMRAASSALTRRPVSTSSRQALRASPAWDHAQSDLRLWGVQGAGIGGEQCWGLGVLVCSPAMLHSTAQHSAPQHSTAAPRQHLSAPTCPNCAVSDAKMMSHISASSHPPPSAYPFTAAMRGLRTLQAGRAGRPGIAGRAGIIRPGAALWGRVMAAHAY